MRCSMLVGSTVAICEAVPRHTMASVGILLENPNQLNNTHFEGMTWKNTLNSTHRTRL